MAADKITEIWVSATARPAGDGSRKRPFDTLERAQQAVRSLLAAGDRLTTDILVHVSGTHRLAETLRFGREDSGRDGRVVRWRGAGKKRATISGGRAVTGWSRVTDPGIPIEQGALLWQAHIDPGSACRPLYIDGVRARRAETNSADAYPLGFRPTCGDLPGVSGIQYALDPRNGAGWRDPESWTNVNDIEAVLWTQWKMISVPLKAVVPPSAGTPSLNPVGAPSVGLIELLQPGWDNANLIRGLPTGAGTDTAGVIQLQGLLAAPQVRAGMTVTANVGGARFPLGAVTDVSPEAQQFTVADKWLVPGLAATFEIADPATGELVLGQPSMWSFWRVTKFVNAYHFCRSRAIGISTARPAPCFSLPKPAPIRTAAASSGRRSRRSSAATAPPTCASKIFASNMAAGWARGACARMRTGALRPTAMSATRPASKSSEAAMR